MFILPRRIMDDERHPDAIPSSYNRPITSSLSIDGHFALSVGEAPTLNFDNDSQSTCSMMKVDFQERIVERDLLCNACATSPPSSSSSLRSNGTHHLLCNKSTLEDILTVKSSRMQKIDIRTQQNDTKAINLDFQSSESFRKRLRPFDSFSFPSPESKIVDIRSKTESEQEETPQSSEFLLFQIENIYGTLQNSYSELELKLRAAQAAEAQLRANLIAEQHQKEAMARELLALRALLCTVTAHREECLRELEVQNQLHLIANEKTRRSQEETHAALLDYAKVMSERDDVHQELEDLSNQLARAIYRAESAESRLQMQLEKTITQQLQHGKVENEVSLDDAVCVSCHKLRNERDEVVTRLRSCMRQVETLNGEHSDTQRQFKELKEQYDVLCEMEMRRLNLNGGLVAVDSRDSAIENDMGSGEMLDPAPLPRHEVTMEAMQIFCIHVDCERLSDVLDVASCYVVTHLQPGAKLSGLQRGDQIISISGTSLQANKNLSSSSFDIYQLLQESTCGVGSELIVARFVTQSEKSKAAPPCQPQKIELQSPDSARWTLASACTSDTISKSEDSLVNQVATINSHNSTIEMRKKDFKTGASVNYNLLDRAVDKIISRFHTKKKVKKICSSSKSSSDLCRDDKDSIDNRCSFGTSFRPQTGSLSCQRVSWHIDSNLHLWASKFAHTASKKRKENELLPNSYGNRERSVMRSEVSQEYRFEATSQNQKKRRKNRDKQNSMSFDEDTQTKLVSSNSFTFFEKWPNSATNINTTSNSFLPHLSQKNVSKQTLALNCAKQSSSNEAAGDLMHSRFATSRTLPIEMDLRQIVLPNISKPLKIPIRAGRRYGGVFIDKLESNHTSVDILADLFEGDQIIEFCGFDLRKTDYEIAHQLITNYNKKIVVLLVMYNPREREHDDLSSSIYNNLRDISSRTRRVSQSDSAGSCTPTNSPQAVEGKMFHKFDAYSTMTSEIKDVAKNPEEPRWVFISRADHSHLGFAIVGGAQVGIFVSEILSEKMAGGAKGLRRGDLILQFNGVDFREITAEHAALEMARPSEDARILVQNQLHKYFRLQNQSIHDGFYMKSQVEWQIAASKMADVWPPSIKSAPSLPMLNFQKNAIFQVESTLPPGEPRGCWRVRLLDSHGAQISCGLIPSARHWDHLLVKQCANSNDYRSITLPYIRLKRLYASSKRPIVLVGPLAEDLIAKLCMEHSELITSCPRELLKSLPSGSDSSRLECKQRYGSTCASSEYTEAVSLSDVRHIAITRHCVFELLPSAVEKLYNSHIFPMVLILRYHNAKHVREVRETRCHTEKMSLREAKEQLKHYQEIEASYYPYLTSVVQGDTLDVVCSQLLAIIVREQSAPVWLPDGFV